MIMFKKKELEISGSKKDTTTNRMEMMAALKALRAVKKPSRIKLFTDSQYLQRGASKYIHGWSRNDWQSAKNRELKNLDLWMKLMKQIRRHTVSWIWVKGHSGIEGNERADKLAGDAYRKLRKEVTGK